MDDGLDPGDKQGEDKSSKNNDKKEIGKEMRAEKRPRGPQQDSGSSSTINQPNSSGREYRDPPYLEIEVPPGVDPVWFESYLNTRRSGIHDLSNQQKRRVLEAEARRRNQPDAV